MWPNLAGQGQAYLVKTMKDYRDGARPDPLMAPPVAGMSDEDIESLAAYYSGLSGD
jgi:cytochrome c553